MPKWPDIDPWSVTEPCSEELIARIETLHSRGYISLRSLGRNARFAVEIDHMRDELIVSLDRALAAKDVITDTKTVRYPKNWKQGIREAFTKWLYQRDEVAGAWFARRWPVEYAVETFKVQDTRMCPHVDIPNDRDQHLRWLFRLPNPRPWTMQEAFEQR